MCSALRLTRAQGSGRAGAGANAARGRPGVRLPGTHHPVDPPGLRARPVDVGSHRVGWPQTPPEHLRPTSPPVEPWAGGIAAPSSTRTKPVLGRGDSCGCLCASPGSEEQQGATSGAARSPPRPWHRARQALQTHRTRVVHRAVLRVAALPGSASTPTGSCSERSARIVRPRRSAMRWSSPREGCRNSAGPVQPTSLARERLHWGRRSALH